MNEEELEYEAIDEDGEVEEVEVETEPETPFLYCPVCDSEYCDGSICDNPNCPW